MAFYAGSNPENYTIGGSRFWFNRLLDGSTTPKRYEGFYDVGNVVEATIESEKDEIEHFSFKTGARYRDRAVVRTITEDLLVTFDELTAKNLQHLFLANDITDVVASTGTGIVTSEIAKVKIGELTILAKGYGATNIVVTNLAGSSTYTTPDDYTEVDVIGGYKGLSWLAGSVGPNVANGDYVKISYNYNVRAHKLMKPLTTTVIEGQCVFFGVSDNGNEFIREFNNVQMQREGSFGMNGDDWTTGQYRIKVLDDSDDNPTQPAGLLYHFGTGQGV